MSSALAIRRATKQDLPALGVLGALLLRTHHDFDPQRFMAPGADPERGYAWFLGTQLSSDDVAIFVAERDGTVVGYVYAGIEPLSWKELRDEAGYIHDLLVADEARRLGVGEALLDAALAGLRGRGMPRVVVGTAAQNETARRLFERRGFRATMIEMTLEL